MNSAPRLWPRRAGRAVVGVLLVLVGAFFVGRGVVEVLTLDPRHPESFRDDWGGPSYLGVLLVHTGPGLLALVLAGLAVRHIVRRPLRSRRLDHAPELGPQDGPAPRGDQSDGQQ